MAASYAVERINGHLDRVVRGTVDTVREGGAFEAGGAGKHEAAEIDKGLLSGCGQFFLRFAQHVSSTPYRLDMVLAGIGCRELLA